MNFLNVYTKISKKKKNTEHNNSGKCKNGQKLSVAKVLGIITLTSFKVCFHNSVNLIVA